MTIFSEEKLFFAAACSNFVLLVAEIIAFVLSISETGAEIFIRFCGISNLLVLLSSFFALLSVYCNVRKGCGTNPQSHIFRYVTTCLSTVTLFVVLLVLLPHEKDPKELLSSTSDWPSSLPSFLSAFRERGIAQPQFYLRTYPHRDRFCLRHCDGGAQFRRRLFRAVLLLPGVGTTDLRRHVVPFRYGGRRRGDLLFALSRQ